MLVELACGFIQKSWILWKTFWLLEWAIHSHFPRLDFAIISPFGGVVYVLFACRNKARSKGFAMDGYSRIQVFHWTGTYVLRNGSPNLFYNGMVSEIVLPDVYNWIFGSVSPLQECDFSKRLYHLIKKEKSQQIKQHVNIMQSQVYTCVFNNSNVTFAASIHSCISVPFA